MGSHLIDGEFQSDKYPTTPRGKVPLSVKDKSAQDLLWIYAQRRRSVDEGFSTDLETALRLTGYAPEVALLTEATAEITDSLSTIAGQLSAQPELRHRIREMALNLFSLIEDAKRKICLPPTFAEVTSDSACDSARQE